LKTGVRGPGSGVRERPLLIRGGTVWGEDGAVRADVRVVGGTVADVGLLAPQDGETVVDATGLDVVPGMIDVHVHVDDRIGAYELADTFASASEIAVRHGVTTLAGFVTQQEDETLLGAVARCVARGTHNSYCDFTFHLTPTFWPWEWGEVEELIRKGFVTFKLYTTYRGAGLFTGYPRMRGVMGRLAGLGGSLLVHCEDDATLAAADTSGLDPADARWHARLRPEEAEVSAIRTVLGLAEATGCRTHVVHVSTAAGVAAVGEAREHSPVSCETAPHYFALDDSVLAGPHGHRFLCTPPLREAATRARVEEAAAAGAFDLFATDHCAFTRADKDRHAGDFRAVPKGLAGVGALVPLAFELLVRRHGLPLSEVVRVLAANPARLLGAYPRKGTIAAGSDGDLAVLDREGPERPVVSSLANAYETYPGRTTTLAVRHVFVGGRETVRDGTLTAQSAAGRCLGSV
jgi:dihydropyrimidinase